MPNCAAHRCSTTHSSTVPAPPSPKLKPQALRWRDEHQAVSERLRRPVGAAVPDGGRASARPGSARSAALRLGERDVPQALMEKLQVLLIRRQHELGKLLVLVEKEVA